MDGFQHGPGNVLAGNPRARRGVLGLARHFQGDVPRRFGEREYRAGANFQHVGTPPQGLSEGLHAWVEVEEPFLADECQRDGSFARQDLQLLAVGLLLLLNWKCLKRHWWSHAFYSTHIKQSKIYPPPTLGCS
jgi:hypothetical protein